MRFDTQENQLETRLCRQLQHIGLAPCFLYLEARCLQQARPDLPNRGLRSDV